MSLIDTASGRIRRVAIDRGNLAAFVFCRLASEYGTATILLATTGMQRYLDLSGNSGIVEYENEAESISVRFRSGKLYVYTFASAGRDHIELMKRLAAAGRGLATYISQHPDVKTGYVG